ncbi:hypothetical protein GCM10009550_73970 [Actinocorallia libanotica]|uniref:DDE family transposase n=1 Tax=Actinocorallia libanotica TaxID=46162 RepID=A0ABP4CIL3_9ACTN
MNTLRVPRPGVGRPRARPERVIADKAYSSRAIRTHLRGRGVATRYDKLAHHYQAGITLVSALLWINQDPPDRPDSSRARARRRNSGG